MSLGIDYNLRTDRLLVHEHPQVNVSEMVAVVAHHKAIGNDVGTGVGYRKGGNSVDIEISALLLAVAGMASDARDIDPPRGRCSRKFGILVRTIVASIPDQIPVTIGPANFGALIPEITPAGAREAGPKLLPKGP